MKAVRFTLKDAESAWDGKFNCGPGAICAALDLTPDELRAKLGEAFTEFDQKGYTNPTLMCDMLRACGASFTRTYREDEPLPHGAYPVVRHGVIRIQFGGPWTKPGVPMRVRYRKTHWVAARDQSTEIFDINAMCLGGWISYSEWAMKLIPWLIKECYYPKADGSWWATHAIEIVR